MISFFSYTWNHLPEVLNFNTTYIFSYPRIALIKLDFPTPELPVIPMLISTSFQRPSFVLKNSSMPDTPCSSMCPWTSSINRNSQESSMFIRTQRRYMCVIRTLCCCSNRKLYFSLSQLTLSVFIQPSQTNSECKLFIYVFVGVYLDDVIFLRKGNSRKMTFMWPATTMLCVFSKIQFRVFDTNFMTSRYYPWQNKDIW